jgi:hypothetical protein
MYSVFEMYLDAVLRNGLVNKDDETSLGYLREQSRQAQGSADKYSVLQAGLKHFFSL